VLSRRGLFSRTAAVLAGTVLARMPLAGKPTKALSTPASGRKIQLVSRTREGELVMWTFNQSDIQGIEDFWRRHEEGWMAKPHDASFGIGYRTQKEC
jgi:hypothetical protein